MKRGMSRWDSLPASSPASCGPEPICQENIEWNCPVVQQCLVTATCRLSATRVMLPPCIDKQITVSQHSNASWKIHLHPSALSLCYLVGFSLLREKRQRIVEGEEPRLLWQRRLWKGCVANINTDGVAGLSGWWLITLPLQHCWEIILPIRWFFKVHILHKSKLSKLVKIIPYRGADRKRDFN